MKGTVFSVALNHRSQLDARDQAFQPPVDRPKPRSGLSNRNTHLANGEGDPFRPVKPCTAAARWR